MFCPRISSSMHRKLSYEGARYAKYKTEAGNLKTPNARPVLPSWHSLGGLRSPLEIPGSNLFPAAGQPNKDDFFQRSPNFESQTPALKATTKTGRADARR